MKHNIEQCIDKTRIDLNSSWADVKARIKRNECIQIHIKQAVSSIVRHRQLLLTGDVFEDGRPFADSIPAPSQSGLLTNMCTSD